MNIRSLILVGSFLLTACIAAADQSQISRAHSPTQVKQVAPVAQLVDGLAARLHQDPNDAAGWLLLAKSYRHLGRPSEAGAAYAKAKRLGKTDPDLESWLNGQSLGDADLKIIRNWLMSE
jgi:cytochrome c-type biogenesis protein CcmH